MAPASSMAPSARRKPDVFRPKFPLDPHAALSSSGREPWFLKTDRLPSLASQSRRDVILVLGAPTTEELSPLLLSKHLSSSLLIIATHAPPDIPHTTLPTVRILRLKQALAIEDAGAVRFVNVLEWAERVARLWRRHGGVGAVELAEEEDGHEYLTPPTLFGFYGSQSTPVSPRSSTSTLSTNTNANLPPSRPRSVSARLLTVGRTRQSMLPAVDPTQRPFDGLLNFLPGNTSDKALLKQSILVTTISRPFLVAADPRPICSRGKRSSLPWPSKAHLVHLLPTDTRSFTLQARTRLVQSLESFLLSFAYPGSAGMSMGGDDCMERARPFIMQASTLGDLVVNKNDFAGTSNSPYERWTNECTLAELVFCGSLDPIDSSLSSTANQGFGKGPINPMDRTAPRAWISGPSDVILVSDDTNILSTPNVLVTPPEPAVLSSPSPSSFGLGVTRSHGAYPPLSIPQNSIGPTMSTSASLPSSFGRPMSMAGASPLVPKRARGRHNSLGASGSSRPSGLPTPPDSEESGSDVHTPAVNDISEHTDAEASYRRRGDDNDDDSGAEFGAGAAAAADSTSSQKSKKLRWRFWRGSISMRSK
ncbi:unnamed protein product [Somion occarium]|uniref:Uncharacterized protein n=1 Tax=Somion occarium TaxID=3059160 RepID=A0ABP1CVC3_9APHY